MANSARRRAVSEVCLEGLRTTEFPAARAGPIFQAAISSGKFQGRTAPTTPTGSRTMIAMASSPTGADLSYTLSINSACHLMVSMASGRSIESQSRMGLPDSMLSITASSRRLRVISLHSRMRTSLRSAGANFAHRPSSNACRALRTARSTSSAPQAATSASGSPVAGLVDMKVAPESAGRNLPSMNELAGRMISDDSAAYSSLVSRSSMSRSPLDRTAHGRSSSCG